MNLIKIKKEKMNKKLFFKKFKTKKLIWKSKMSMVYEGINVKENEPVAIKFRKRKKSRKFGNRSIYFI